MAESNDKMKLNKPDIKTPPGSSLALTNPGDRMNDESWHMSWVYRGDNGVVRHGDNIFTIKPRLTTKSFPGIRKLIAEQMDCRDDELCITSITKLPE